MEPVYGWWLPPNISTYGHQVDELIIIVHWFMGALFVGWGIFFVYCLVHFRQRPGHVASYESAHSRIPKLIEVGVAVFEAFLLIGLSYPVWAKVRTEFPPVHEALELRVVAQQFAWNLHYPGRDRIFGRTAVSLVSDVNPVGLDRSDPAGVDDLVTLNTMHIPVNRPVIVHLSSKDVIHSFSVPVLRVKQDVVPGMSIPIWFEANQTGRFDIGCAQLCGVGHTLMRGFIVIDSAEDYEAWLKEEEAYLAPPQIL